MSSVIVIDMLLVVGAGGIVRVEGGGAVNCSCFLM